MLLDKMIQFSRDRFIRYKILFHILTRKYEQSNLKKTATDTS